MKQMTLRQYLASLNAIVKKNPKLLDADVIYASDDEGNSYDPVLFPPSVGKLMKSKFGEYWHPDEKGNLICIN